ncbi:histidine kinase [bacterium SCSIO 12643]|nr:histidine kinase [bacterium SCSIO 12643]
MPSNETYDVFQDSKGYIWIGTDNGVVKYDGHTFISYNTKHGLKDNTVFRIQEDSNGRIWFMTYSKKLYYLENNRILPYKFNDKIINSISNLLSGHTITGFKKSASNSIILTLVNFSTITIDDNGTVNTTIEPNQLSNIDTITSNSMAQIINTVNRMDKQKNSKHIFLTNKLGKVHFFANKNRFGIGTNSGLIIFNEKQIIAHFLKDYHITGFTIDNENGIWASTLTSGLIYIPNKDLHFYKISNSEKNLINGAIKQDNSIIFNFGSNQNSQYYNYKYDEISNEFSITSDTIDSYLTPIDDTKKGLKFVNPIHIKHIFIAASTFIQIDNNFIFADDIIVQFNTSFKYKKKIDPSQLIIATNFYGEKWYFDRNRHIRPKKPFFYNIIKQSDKIKIKKFFLSKDKILWTGTLNGISILSQNLKNEWTPRSVITKHDGLELADIRQLIFYNDYLFFANNEGIGKIHKSHLDDSLPPPILHIQSLLSNEYSMNIDTTINLTHDSNNIQINYHAISYKSQNDIIYKYQLSPINDSWQTTTNDNIVFNALPPNDYTLKLKAINIDGVESEVQILQFSIIPAFWMTWWFKAVVIIIAIIFGYKLSIRTIKIYKTQAQFQKTINEMQIISLQSKMNPHFIFNSLNSIQNYILKNEKTNANQYLLEFSKLIRTILQNSDSTTILLQDELETLKMYVNLEKKRIRKEFKYTEEMDSEIDLEKCIIPSLLIQPYIENAIWHGKVYSNPNGEIKLSIHKKQNTLFIEICDNGIGIKNAEASKVKKTKHKSLGTSVTKKRIELLSELNNEMSDVTISEAFRNENEDIYVGTKITFNIPYVLKF